MDLYAKMKELLAHLPSLEKIPSLIEKVESIIQRVETVEAAVKGIKESFDTPAVAVASPGVDLAPLPGQIIAAHGANEFEDES